MPLLTRIMIFVSRWFKAAALLAAEENYGSVGCFEVDFQAFERRDRKTEFPQRSIDLGSSNPKDCGD